MARTEAPRCDVCSKLYQATRPAQAPYASPPPEGSSLPSLMRRLYVRGESRTYLGIGWICPFLHVVVGDPPYPAAHLPMPTYPPQFLCTLTGDLVGA